MPRILSVDDSMAIRRIMRTYLKDLDDLDFLEAENGQVALDLLADPETPKVDVVLLDWSMPVMGGLETLRELRRREDTRDIPVIIVTAEQDLANVTAAMTEGAHGFVMKPCEKPDLVDKVRAALEDA